ncbi:MAG: NAD-binding protein [Alphaproteobacteria bacterium]
MTTSGKIAVIGLGSMGWGAAVSLLRAGFESRGCDLRDEVRAKFTAEGGVACVSPAEAADGATTILTFVVNAEQTEAVLFGDGGALETAAPGTVVLSCATVPPAYATDLAARLSQRGMLPLDAPVSGGAAKALTGEMTVMSAGAEAAYAAAQPVLDAIATKVYRLGETPGLGSQVKMINQLLAGVHIAATAEALVFGMKCGLDPATLYEVICASAGNSWMFENRGPHIVNGDYTPHSAVDIFVKDLGIVLQEAGAIDFPTPLAATARAQFEAASAAGLGREDDAAVAKVYARAAGIALPGETD